jgi:uncharacterized protein (TIGR02271 family)
LRFPTLTHAATASEYQHHIPNDNKEHLVMAVNDRAYPQDINSGTARSVAFFKNRDDAHRAISQLQEAGFSQDEIGLIDRDEQEVTTGTSQHIESHEGFWGKVKDFFTGESHDEVDYRDSISGMNWDDNRADYYYRGIGSGGALVSVTGSRIEEARRILQSAGGDLRESGFETTASGINTKSGIGTESNLSDTDERLQGEHMNDQRIQLRGEVLRTYRERVQRGEVRLRKEVITENQSVEVPVTREELVIERVPASADQTAATGEIGTDQEIRVPLSEERARVEKKPIVTEEVRVGKRAVQNTERLSDTVRHEELRVEGEGDAVADSGVLRERKGKKPAA